MTPAQRRYRQRVADRKCVWCNAGLQDGDRVLCIECEAKKATAKAVYLASERGKASVRRRARTVYAERREAGLCVSGCGTATDRARCEACRLQYAAWQQQHEGRREELRAGCAGCGRLGHNVRACLTEGAAAHWEAIGNRPRAALVRRQLTELRGARRSDAIGVAGIAKWRAKCA